MARPTKANPLGKQKRPKRDDPIIIAKLKEAFWYDCPDVEACYHANISIDTLRRMREGDKKLSEEFDRLKNEPTFKARKCVVKAAENDSEIAIKYLERKRKKEFSLKIEQEITWKDWEALFSQLTPQQLANIWAEMQKGITI